MIPKKIANALVELGITNVVDGYITKIGDYRHPIQAAFTGWDKSGKPICVIYKSHSMPTWSLTPEKRF